MKEKAIAKIRYCFDKLSELVDHPDIRMSDAVKGVILKDLKECVEILSGGWGDDHVINFSNTFYKKVKEFYTLYSSKPFSYKNDTTKTIAAVGYVGVGAKTSRLATEIIHRKV